MPDKDHQGLILTRLLIDDVDQGFIIGKKQDTLIAHSRAPQVQTKDNGVKLKNGNIQMLPIGRPFTIAPVWSKYSAKTNSICEQVQFGRMKPSVLHEN